MSSQRTVDMLNQTASGTRTSPRKRRRLNDDDLSSEIASTPATDTKTESLRRSSRKSVSKLQTPTVARATRLPVASNEITDHLPVSPNLPMTQDDDLTKRIPNRKRKLNQKGEVIKSSGYKFRGKSMNFDIKGVDLNSYNSPAKGNKGRRPSLGRALKEHPVKLANKNMSQEAKNAAQWLPNPVSERGVSHGSALSMDPEDESNNSEEGAADAGVDVDEEGIDRRSKPSVQERKKSGEVNHGRNMQKSNQSKGQLRQKEKSLNSSQQTGHVKKRKPLSEEEVQMRNDNRRRDKAKEQNDREANAKESKKSAMERFDERREHFGQGIEVQAEMVGGLETWKVMGAGALTIEYVEDRTLKMDTECANHVWKLLKYLKTSFERLNRHGKYRLDDEVAAKETIERLKKKCTLSYLRPDGNKNTPGDPTVIKLYQRIIPELIHLLKEVLEARYVDGLSLPAIEELLSLAEIGLELCKVAMEWTPKPTKLPLGIRRSVHDHINPNLRVIKIWLADRQQYEEHRAIQQKVRTNLALAQQNNRERKQKLWEERQQRLASHHAHSTYGLHQPPSSSAEIFDIDEID